MNTISNESHFENKKKKMRYIPIGLSMVQATTTRLPYRYHCESFNHRERILIKEKHQEQVLLHKKSRSHG